MISFINCRWSEAKHRVMWIGIIITLLLSASTARSQGPIGDPDEVWVTSSSGDTICVNELVMLEIYVANSTIYSQAALTFELYSPDDADWEWVDLGAGGEYGALDLIENTRLQIGLEVYLPGWAPSSPSGAPSDTFGVSALSWTPPHFDSGTLEHTYNLGIRPTRVGTICIDKGFIPPAAAPWLFTTPDGGTVMPSWGGPYCFTVEPPKGDVDCSGEANVGDVVYMINWIFKGGPEPCK